MKTTALLLVSSAAFVACSDSASMGGPGDAIDAISADAPSDAQPPLVDAGVPPGKVPIFIAQGMLGRTIVSCDDGMNWVADHSWEKDGDHMMCDTPQDVTCGDPNCMYWINDACVTRSCCNDTPDVPEDVAFGENTIVGAWGHGTPGALRTTADGVTWTTTHVSNAFSVASDGHRFVAAGNNSSYWSDDGTTWTQGGDPNFPNSNTSPVRAIGYGAYGNGGRFVAVASGGGQRDITVSDDGGVTWRLPSVIPNTCAIEVGASGGDIVGGNDVLLIVDRNGTACRSTDGGDTWSVSPTGLTEIVSQGVWTGTEFVFWGQNQMINSARGDVWMAVPMETPMPIGPVAQSANGTFVAMKQVFDAYDRQILMRSTNGLRWDPLPTSAFPQGHPIHHIVFGYAAPSSVCPLRN